LRFGILQISNITQLATNAIEVAGGFGQGWSKGGHSQNIGMSS
jgi:hypothetical protein